MKVYTYKVFTNELIFFVLSRHNSVHLIEFTMLGQLGVFLDTVYDFNMMVHDP